MNRRPQRQYPPGLLGLCLLVWMLSALSSAQSTCDANANVESLLVGVAEQQRRAVEMRRRWGFHQHVEVRLWRLPQVLAREELRHFEVTPTDDGEEHQLLDMQGAILDRKKPIHYTRIGHRTGIMDLDGEMLETMSDDNRLHMAALDDQEDTMYPFSYAAIAAHQFALLGNETVDGRRVYRLRFEPNRRVKKKERGYWGGTLAVDCETMAPVEVDMKQVRKLPLLFRATAGLSIRQQRYLLRYQQLDDGTWFPVEYEGLIDLRLVFAYQRRLGITLRNDQFVRGRANSDIRYDLTEPASADDGAPRPLRKREILKPPSGTQAEVIE